AVAAGHSAGGAAVIGAAAMAPQLFSTVWAFEPVLYPPQQTFGAHPLAAVARKRRATFPSRQHAREHFAARQPFRHFHPHAFDAYTRYGLVDNADGIRLACSPEDEAAIYDGAATGALWLLLGSVTTPVTEEQPQGSGSGAVVDRCLVLR